MASSAYLRVMTEAVTAAQATIPSLCAGTRAATTTEQRTIAVLRIVSTDLGEAVKLAKARSLRPRSKTGFLGPAAQPHPRPPSAPDATTLAAKAAESKWRDTDNLLFLRRLSLDKIQNGNKFQASGRGAPSHSRPSPERHVRPHGLNHKQRRSRAKREREAISDHIVYMGLHPEHFGGLRRAHDGSFSIESLMSYWGNSVGLTAETILKALREHLLMGVDGGKPKLRFSISQGSDSSDSVWIKVRQSAGL